MTVEAGVAQILHSKKYSGLDRALIARVFAETAAKYPGKSNHKDIVKAVKRELHIIYGAFLKKDCHTRAEALIKHRIGAMNSGPAGATHNDCFIDALYSDKEFTKQLMELHISTSERIGSIVDIYDWIGGYIGANDTVADIGCGFNPFALSFLPNRPNAYNAYDIDGRTVSLINLFFSLYGDSYRARTLDAITQSPREPANVALLFKLIPLLERRRKGRASRLLYELFSLYDTNVQPDTADLCTAKYVKSGAMGPTRAADVTGLIPESGAKGLILAAEETEFIRAAGVHTAIVSFPTKSASGRDVGMEAFYTDLFTHGLSDNLVITEKVTFANEIFFVVKKSSDQTGRHCS